MPRIFTLFLFLHLFSFVLFAKVPIVLTKISSALMTDKVFSTRFKLVYVDNEEEVLTQFSNKQTNFAIIRKDILEKLSLQQNHRPYYIIGELAKHMKLMFLAKNNDYQSIQDLSFKQIVINPLYYHTNKYLKQILKQNSLTYTVNLRSMDIYPAFHALKSNTADVLFILATPLVEKKFKPYNKPYPQGFLQELQKFPELTCNEKSCALKYYLIASDHVGKMVMHNIYTQLKTLWSKEKKLLSTIGNYYIDTTYNVSTIERRKKEQPKTQYISHLKYTFGRAPWMDIAINEAIRGKGKAENVLPMLDLSYKYIRFSKGEKGITTAPNDNKEGSWCAAYICWTLNKAGYTIHNKWRMASQSFRYFKDTLYKKIDKPIFGAITLYTSMRNPSHGHVGYLFGRTPSGKYILLGGNQNNRLKFSSYPAYGFGNYRFNGFYVPIGYEVTAKDTLTKKDIYTSANLLNKRYGIKKSKQTRSVR